MLFVNTRPQDRAEVLTSALVAHDIAVIELPLLVLNARPLSSALIALYRALSTVNVIVVVSPTAVEIGMRYLAQLGMTVEDLSHIHWVAVGIKTAECLKKYQIESHVPQLETSEGMLSLDVFKQLSMTDKVAFWRGEGGRQLMMQQLIQQGIEVANFVLYERRCPVQSVAKMPYIISRLQAVQSYIMLISSEASWLNWLDLIQSEAVLLNHKAQYWVLGDRLCAILSDYKKQNDFDFQIIKLNDLNIVTITQHLLGLQGKL